MKVYDFPDVKIGKQLFHVPGAAVEGGFTSGGVRLLSPEPGGRAVLEIEPSMRDEWDAPWLSWLMSKINGQVFRVPLTKTPQLITARSIQRPAFDAYPRDQQEWHAVLRPDDLTAQFTASALEGSSTVRIDMARIGPVLKPGHVIGHGSHTYMVDEITYDASRQATATITPPVRSPIAAGSTCKFTPVFTGTIANGGEIRNTYDRSNNGLIQLGKLILTEAIVDE